MARVGSCGRGFWGDDLADKAVLVYAVEPGAHDGSDFGLGFDVYVKRCGSARLKDSIQSSWVGTHQRLELVM